MLQLAHAESLQFKTIELIAKELSLKFKFYSYNYSKNIRNTQNVSLSNYFTFKIFTLYYYLCFWGCLHHSYVSDVKDLLLLISSQFYIQAHQVDTLKLAICRIYTMDISKDGKPITPLGFGVFLRTSCYAFTRIPWLLPSPTLPEPGWGTLSFIPRQQRGWRVIW